MSCLQYLNHINERINKEKEKEDQSIRTSLSFLKMHLNNWSKANEIQEHHEFGSFVRGTKLPKCIDSDTDIDYMVVFDSTRFKPQTYIDKIRDFANTYYRTSTVHQDHPTMVIELGNVRFEITPAIKLYGASYPRYNIPAPQQSFLQWIDTYPEEIEQNLAEANRRNSYLLKPLIRLLKYWNVKNGKILTSYRIEQYVISHIFYGCRNLEDFFMEGANWLSMTQTLSETKRRKVAALQIALSQIRNYKQSGNELLAELQLRSILPDL